MLWALLRLHVVIRADSLSLQAIIGLGDFFKSANELTAYADIFEFIFKEVLFHHLLLSSLSFFRNRLRFSRLFISGCIDSYLILVKKNNSKLSQNFPVASVLFLLLLKIFFLSPVSFITTLMSTERRDQCLSSWPFPANHLPCKLRWPQDYYSRNAYSNALPEGQSKYLSHARECSWKYTWILRSMCNRRHCPGSTTEPVGLSSPVILNLWVATPSWFRWPFHEGSMTTTALGFSSTYQVQCFILKTEIDISF